jgi:hypothetical protein
LAGILSTTCPTTGPMVSGMPAIKVPTGKNQHREQHVKDGTGGDDQRARPHRFGHKLPRLPLTLSVSMLSSIMPDNFT